jgi:hypothetical protein
MALFGTQRDVSLFRHLSRELMWDIISQQCAFYQLIADQTKVNIYGEAAGSKYYNGPVLLNTLIERGDNASPTDDFGVSFDRPMTFRFLRDDLLGKNPIGPSGAFSSAFSNAFSNAPNSTYTTDTGNYPGTSYGANLVPEVGDIIMWNNSYWEIDNVNDNQLFVGKDPAYPYETNPLNPGLDNYGSNISIICTAHYVPSDKVQITRERL